MAQDGEDSLHRLVIDLHKTLNKLAANCSEEILAGAHVFGLNPEDREPVVATAMPSRAARRRTRSRSAWRHHNATFTPKVVGSAWTPWVRPTVTVSRCSRATRLSTAMRSEEAATRRSAASRRAQHSAVSTTSEDVSP